MKKGSQILAWFFVIFGVIVLLANIGLAIAYAVTQSPALVVAIIWLIGLLISDIIALHIIDKYIGV